MYFFDNGRICKENDIFEENKQQGRENRGPAGNLDQQERSAQAMEGSSVSAVMPKFTGMDTQTRWVSVTVQEVPSALVSQVTTGEPGQLVTTVPKEAVGVRITGWLISTHCVADLPVQPALTGPGAVEQELQYSLITGDRSL